VWIENQEAVDPSKTTAELSLHCPFAKCLSDRRPSSL
jgi:hypothetical protein